MKKPQALAGAAGPAIKFKILALAASLALAVVWPPAAQAHAGSANPVASSYVAKLASVPAGLEGRVLGGDLRMWLRVPPTLTVVVLDYRGAPYLRFSSAGVQVNTNSAMFYLNQPVPVTPPVGLSPSRRPHWLRSTSGHIYSWHDGRLHALAAVALAPGQTFAGRWKIPLLVGGRPAAITGGLYYAPNPSIVWFWPIAVVLLCLWAASRLGNRRLDRAVARVLSLAALTGIGLLAVGHELYGEPFVSSGQEIILGLILAFVAGTGLQVALRGPGSFSLILIAVGALWAAVDFIPVLLHGYVLAVIPAFLVRMAAVACLAGGVGLMLQLFAFRLVDVPDEASGPPEPLPEHERDDAEAWESLA